MARRVLESEQRAKGGKAWSQLGAPKAVSVVKEIGVHKTHRGVFSLQFNCTGDILAVGFGSGGIELYDCEGNSIKELRSCRQGGHSVMALRFHPKDPNILYAATTEGVVHIFNCENGEQVTCFEEPGNEINCMDFSVDGFNFATGGKDLNVRVYDAKHNKLVQLFEGYSNKTASDKQLVSNTMRVFSLRYHPNNQHVFLTGGWDNHIKIWDARTNDGVKRNIRGPHICGDSIDMKGNTILSGQWTALHALQEYDYTSEKVTRELNYPHVDGAFLYCAQYCNDDLVLAGGSGTKTANFIQISTNTNVGQYELGAVVQAIDSSKGGRIAAVGGATSNFAILKVSD